MSELPSLYQEVIHRSRYSRYIPELGRRESWEETVNRLINYLQSKVPEGTNLTEIQQAIMNLEVMPSMRLLMTAGEAADRDNMAIYNCSYAAVNNKRVFAEALYILLNGTGLGFSCERQEIASLPNIPDKLREVDDVIVVGDSKLG